MNRPVLPSRLADRFELEERLGSGGSAEVWRATDRQLHRPVAVKVLHPHLLTDATTRARFEQEARAAAGLAHPSIVTVYDVVVDEDGAAIVMEAIDGVTLAARLRDQGPIAPNDAARICADVAGALAHAHEHGIVHRDVKPANVLLSADGRTRLTDFGIARLLEEGSMALTSTGTIAGTLRYLAPEQLSGEHAGPLADVYGLGVLLYEMLTGRPPYEVGTPVALAAAQQTVPRSVPGAPRALQELIRSCLDPDPERRPASAGLVADELKRWLTGNVPTTLIARPGEDDTVVIAGAAQPDAVAAVAPGPSDTSRRLPLAAILGGVAASVVVALVLALVTSRPPATPPALAASPTPVATAPPQTPAPEVPPGPDVARIHSEVGEFAALIAEGEQDGLIHRGAAQDLRKEAEDISKEADEGDFDKVAEKLADLREKIAERERDGRITPDFAERLREAVDEIEAALGG